MTHLGNAKDVCEEIAGEVRDIASWLADRRLTQAQFSTAVLTLEEAKVKRFGLTLTAFTYEGGKTRFNLRFADTGELCACLTFEPTTGELTITHHCA